MPSVRPRSFDAWALVASVGVSAVLVCTAIGCGGGDASDPAEAKARVAGELRYLEARQGLSAAQVDCVAGEVVRARHGDDLAEFEKAVGLLRVESDQPVDQASVDLLAEAVTACVRKVK